MIWRVYGERMETADLAGSLRVFCPIQTNVDIYLRAIRTWVILHDTSFSDLQMEIRVARGTATGKVLATSVNAFQSTEISSQPYAAREIGFEFNSPLLQGDQLYHLVLKASGYTGSAANHLAWMRAYPDATYPYGSTPDFHDLATAPFRVSLIGCEP